MSRKLFLHIGTEKTGSTAIQHALAASRDSLQAHGLYVPHTFGHLNHTKLIPSSLDDDVYDNIKAKHIANTEFSVRKFRRRLQNLFERELSAVPDSTHVIVTTELIHSRILKPTEVRRLLDHFRDVCDEIVVIVFLRRQDRLAVSRFSSALRAGHPGYDDVFENIGSHYYYRSPPDRVQNDFEDYYDYQRLIERFTPWIPAANIRVGIYPEKSPPTAILQMFSDALGIGDGMLTRASSVMNPSMSAAAQFLLSEINQRGKIFYPDGTVNRPFLELRDRIEREHVGEKRRFARHEAEQFLGRFTDSNEWVRRNFRPDLTELFDGSFSDYSEHAVNAEPDAALRELGAHYAKLAAALPQKRLLVPGAQRWIRSTVDEVRYKTRHVAAFAQRLARATRLRLQSAHKAFTITTARALRFAPRHIAISRAKRSLDTTPRDRPFRITVARILGNDLYPRHHAEQTLTNLRFMIDHEANPAAVRKVFVVNRITDPEKERQIIDLLEESGQQWIHVPFDVDEYQRRVREFAHVANAFDEKAGTFVDIDADQQLQTMIWRRGPSIAYTMNVNGARNLALAQCSESSDWVFPLDGNCFFTAECFEDLLQNCSEAPHLPYGILPMARVLSNDDALTTSSLRRGTDEPQLGFNAHATESFDERYPYGIWDKAELLDRLGIPGDWTHWDRPSWMPPREFHSPQRHLYRDISKHVVFRLSSGLPGIDSSKSQPRRFIRRNVAILRTIWQLDRACGEPGDVLDRFIDRHGDG